MALVLLTGLFLLGIVLGYIYLKRKITPADNSLPDSEPQILVGNLWNSGLLTGKRTFHEIMHDYQRRFGDKFIYWFGSSPCIAFCLPKHAQAIFNDRHSFEQSPLFLPNFDLICPHSLVTLSAAKWKRHVRVMLPVFKRAKVIQHLDTMTDCADRFIDQCLAADQVHTDLVHSCQTVTMNIFGLIAFDYDLDSQVNSKSRTVFHDFLSHVIFVMRMAWMPQWLNKLYLRVNWNYQRTNRFLRQLMTKIVEQEENNQAGEENNDRPKNLISSLVSSLNEQATDEQMTSGLTRVEMFDEVLLSLVAGFETTSTALAWCIFYMSKNAEVQRRMKDELRENDVLISGDVQYLPPLTKEKLDALVYCDCVTKEVLRLAPVAGITTRIALCDTVVDDVTVRRGQTVLIGMHNINTDPRFWHHGDPKQFIPERFLGEDKDHPAYTWLPFGGGHRACIGQDLALLELKVIIVRLMQRGVTFEDTPENIGGYEERLTCYPKKVAIRVRIDRQ